jgi:predicted NAD/FAD-binding protein
MPTAEDRYIRDLIGHIGTLMPEDPARASAVLRELRKRHGRPCTPRWALAASVAILAAVMAIVLDDLGDRVRASEPYARIAHTPDGRTIAMVARQSGSDRIVVYRKELSPDQARELLADPQWGARLVRGAIPLGPVSVERDF